MNVCQIYMKNGKATMNKQDEEAYNVLYSQFATSHPRIANRRKQLLLKGLIGMTKSERDEYRELDSKMTNIMYSIGE